MAVRYHISETTRETTKIYGRPSTDGKLNSKQTETDSDRVGT